MEEGTDGVVNVEAAESPRSELTARKITPTDVAQFIRLEQCQRYLRLRLNERTHGQGFIYDYGVKPQSIPAILTRSGAVFEEMVEHAVSQRYWKINFVADMAHAGQRSDDNDRVIQIARNLSPGEVVILFQPRVLVELDGWHIRGDVDLLRMERDLDGKLHVLIADMKASTTAKVEHRLQVAFYLEMLTRLFDDASVEYADMRMGVLYRGSAGDGADSSAEESVEQEQRDLAEALFATRDALLEIVPDPDSYRGAVRDLVTAPDSVAHRVAETDLEKLPFHLTYKCDGCLFNEYCMKWSAERDDLSLLPHITVEEKLALQRAGVATTSELAALKTFRADGDGPSYRSDLVAAPGKEALVRKLSVTWPVGPHVDELVTRARRYRAFKGDDITYLPYIPSKGYGSLPYSDADHNPNLVRIYIDAQHDYLNDRIYLLGALVVASEHGIEPAHRRRSIVHLTDGPPDTLEKEEALFLGFVDELMRAVVELAAPDTDGTTRAPIHLVFYNHFEQRLLLDGLARHFDAILGATPLYDLVTQQAAFDSPVATYLDQEIRELKNYPMVCQSLQAVAAYLKFDWTQPEDYRQIFRTRMFDFWGKFDEVPREGETPWYTSRARFNSQIPLEYAYAAWDQLPVDPSKKRDDFESYRGATPDLLRGFHARRLDALERIARDFRGNQKTEKSSFDLPDLATFEAKAATMAQAIDEFVTVERHGVLADWKAIRLVPPERRVLMGETLIVRYHEEDQDPETAERNRQNIRLHSLRKHYETRWREEHPDALRMNLPKDQVKECKWSQAGMRFNLRIETGELDCDLDEVLTLTTFRPGERLIIFERMTVDSRLPVSEQTPMQPTAKQMLYAMRCDLVGITVERDAMGRAVRAIAEVEMQGGGGRAERGFAFAPMNERPLVDDESYTLDSDPNDWYGSWCAAATKELSALEAGSTGGHNTLYDRLVDPSAAHATWPESAARAQQRFLDGLDALQHAGALHDFEPSKREYIGRHGDTPSLLVQGPPGTGKSYSTAFALFARLQGALAAGSDFRIFLSCKTHSATDVLLKNVLEVQELLRKRRGDQPEIFAAYFDERLLSTPLFRMTPKETVPDGVIPLHKNDRRQPGEPNAADAIAAEKHCIVATTPGGTYRLLKDRWNNLFGHDDLCDCLVLDEASQMNLPEAVLASLPLKPDGQLIVVGDHRQMPPIVKHDWASEPRRSFQEFRSYESLFLALLAVDPPMIKFEESFRLHADMAEFLRKEIYHLDGIDFFSRRHERLIPYDHPDPFVAAVLHPDHPLVVVVHDEAESMLRNPFEQALITPVLDALASAPYSLEPRHGLGVVVPHRAQRAALQEAIPKLNVLDPHTGAVALSAIDTVERFQGGERSTILVSATESDPAYLLLSSQFLLDPRRLTVALSRAKRKMVLVASQSVFSIFSADEETFEHSQLWKNLLRHWCTVKLWEGQREGRQVTVWGNDPATKP